MSQKTLFITGASSGIGAATVAKAVEAGWRVAGFARSADKLDSLAKTHGDSFLALPGDVTDQDTVEAAVAKCVDSFGGVDAVFANAGLGAQSAGTQQGDPSNWRTMLDVNIWGALITAHATLPALQESEGHFLVTGSRAGRTHMKGSIYGATKWFIHAWATNLSLEMAEWGGRCTIIAPGMVDTPFFDSPKPQGLVSEDVADAVVWAMAQPAHVNVGEVYLTPNR